MCFSCYLVAYHLLIRRLPISAGLIFLLEKRQCPAVHSPPARSRAKSRTSTSTVASVLCTVTLGLATQHPTLCSPHQLYTFLPFSQTGLNIVLNTHLLHGKNNLKVIYKQYEDRIKCSGVQALLHG